MDKVIISDAQDAIASLPFVMGFVPQDATVALLLFQGPEVEQGRMRVLCGAHVEHSEGTEGLARMVAGLVGQARDRRPQDLGVIVVTYAPRETRAERFAVMAEGGFGAAGVRAVEVAAVVGPMVRTLGPDGTGWTCMEDRPAVVAPLVASGAAPVGSRADMRAQADPLPRAAEVSEAVRAWCASGQAIPTASETVAAWTQMLAGDVAVETAPTGTLARAVVGVSKALGGVLARDVVGTGMTRDPEPFRQCVAAAGLSIDDVAGLRALDVRNPEVCSRLILLARLLDGPEVVDALTLVVMGLWAADESMRAGDVRDRMGGDGAGCTLLELVGKALDLHLRCQDMRPVDAVWV